MELWNGLTPRRKDLSTTMATGHEDFLVLVQKIRELQEYVLNFTNNVSVMPALAETLKDAEEQIAALKKSVDSVSLPDEVKEKLAGMEQKLTDVDKRSDITQLHRDFNSLREKVTRNQIEVLQMQSAFAVEVKSFQNKVWGLLEKLQRDTESSLEELREKVSHVDAQLDLQASLDKLSQLK